MQIGEKNYNKQRLRHLVDVLLGLTETMPPGIRKSFDEDYLRARAGITLEEDELFTDVLEFLIYGGFYRRLRDGQIYILG